MPPALLGERRATLIDGTPGYRELAGDPQVPEDPAGIGDWLARNVLRPSMPLFDEARRVMHEDPRIRPATSLAHQLTTLASAGFINRRHDLLLDRRPVVTVADPMVRFHQLLTEPWSPATNGRSTGRVHRRGQASGPPPRPS